MDSPAAVHRMYFSEALHKVLLLGMDLEAEDIVDYFVIQVSLLLSVLTAAAVAIWAGRAMGAWVGLLAGIGSYATSIGACALVFEHRHHHR